MVNYEKLPYKNFKLIKQDGTAVRVKLIPLTTALNLPHTVAYIIPDDALMEGQ